MLSKFFAGSVCTVTLLACLIAAPAAAQTIDKQVYFNFSAPVSLPGVTLPAGTYLFRVVDPIDGGAVVQVLSADWKHHYGYFLVNRSLMKDVPEKAEIRLIETPKKFAQAIRAYWYPGSSSGYEFVYPKKQAKVLFAGDMKEKTQSPLLMTRSTEPSVASTADVAEEGEPIPAFPADTVLD